MKITDVTVVSAVVQAKVELDGGEVEKLGLQVSQSGLQAIAEEKLGAATPTVATLQQVEGHLIEAQEILDNGWQPDANMLGDVTNDRDAEIEADKQRKDRAAEAKRVFDRDL